MVTWGRGILHDNAITQPDTPSTQKSLMPDYFDATSMKLDIYGFRIQEMCKIVSFQRDNKCLFIYLWFI
jgi:hypothetical protein